MLDETHAIDLQSWVPSANLPGSDFPIQNLPFCLFRRKDTHEAFRGGVAIGTQIVDFGAIGELPHHSGIIDRAVRLAARPSLNALMAAGPEVWSALRLFLSRALRIGAPEEAFLSRVLVPQSDAEFEVPAIIGDYTDFFTSQHHARNTGRLFNPDAPPLPNFPWLPIAYHGRASTVAISGTQVQRPLGQSKRPGDLVPTFGPTRRLDYELELGCYIGRGNARGTRIPIDDAEQHIFGVCLLNDWSARDVQGFEAFPLGPFLSKNFLTSVSPWIVTMAALAPYRTRIAGLADDHPALPYLCAGGDRLAGAYDIMMEAWLTPNGSREPHRLSRTSYRHATWTLAQMVTHHTENGCSLNPGDLLGTGTQSGPEPDEAGCILELCEGGRKSIPLPNGMSRTFLEDGDTVTLTAHCEADGKPRIGFGTCVGTVQPADEGN